MTPKKKKKINKIGNKKYFVPDSTGYFYVIVENNFGCVSEASGLVLWEKPVIIDPGTVDELSNEFLFNVFPNPNNGSFSIISEGNQKEVYQVFNLQGKLITTVLANTKTDLTLNKGVYLIKQEHGVKTKRLIVL